MNVQGKVALVTGAGVRLGQAIAIALAQQGMKVAIHYHRSATGARQTLSYLGFPERHRLFQANLLISEDRLQLVTEVEQMLGSISVLVNNAADFFPTPLYSTTEEQWDHLFTLNLKAPFFLAQLVGAQMEKIGEGKIINLVDVSAEQPWINYLPYCATKAGLISITKGLAKVMSPKIHVNGIAPGTVLPPPPQSTIDTSLSIEKSLLKRMGSAEDIVHAVLYLLQADFVTGSILQVDGGRHLV